MTARGSAVERRRGVELGADGFISKPFELKDLRAEDLPPSLMYVWQFCSGHSHGLEWAAVGGARYPDPFSESGTGTFRAGSMEQLRRMCDVSLGLVPRAWVVFDAQRRVWPLL
jgi:CheY-like chemotaxis protein